ncbi:MAG: hypothetical protein RL754_215 [Bacteroidota bacterium]
MAFPKLNFPPGIDKTLRIESQGGQTMFWDEGRKKWLVAEPEEWVRQHCLGYLRALGYDQSQLSSEVGLQTGFRSKRSDIVAHHKGKPIILVECKAPDVKIGQQTFNQAFNYNREIRAPFIWITNGLQHFYWDCTKNQAVNSLPQRV